MVRWILLYLMRFLTSKDKNILQAYPDIHLKRSMMDMTIHGGSEELHFYIDSYNILHNQIMSKLYSGGINPETLRLVFEGVRIPLRQFGAIVQANM